MGLDEKSLKNTDLRHKRVCASVCAATPDWCFSSAQALEQGFSNCGSRPRMGSPHQIDFLCCFFTIIFIDNQKLEKVRQLLLKVSKHLRHLIDKIKPESE